MVVLAQQGHDENFAEWPCKSQGRSTSCGGRQRSVGRRCQVQPRCGEVKGSSRAHSNTRLRHRSSGVKPAEDVELRETIAAPEEKVKEDVEEVSEQTEQADQGLGLVCNMIVDWVDNCADDLLEEEAIRITPYEELEADLWDTISTGSCEEWEELEPPAFETMYLMDSTTGNGQYVLDEAPSVSNLLRLLQQSVVKPQAPAPKELQPPAPVESFPEVAPSPSSRSSTPSRSVRNRRRVIGAVVPVWSSSSAQAAAEQTSSSCLKPVTPMKRAVSTSALALDMLDLTGTPTPSCGRSSRAVEFRIPPGPERKSMGMIKAKSMGALHAVGSQHGLGLVSLSPVLKQGGILPALAADRQSSKAELVAWSVSMSKNKRGGLRLVF